MILPIPAYRMLSRVDFVIEDRIFRLTSFSFKS